MKSRLIINPVAGTDAAPTFLPLINESLREHFGDLDVSLTIAGGDALEIAAKSVADGYDQIFIAGGDGTLNEVLNGVARVENGLQTVQLGLIPLGTGNDFAGALGLSENVPETLEILAQKHSKKVDVGKLVTDGDEANPHYFINVSAGGFIAEVSDAVNPELKSIAGKLAYLIGGAQTIFSFEPVKTHARIVYPNQILEQVYDIEMFAVCNAQMIGGGSLIAPHADVSDGLFDICIFKDVDTFQFLNLLREIAAGTHLDNEQTVYLRASEIEFEFEREIKINLDGEVLSVNRCHYKILPQAVNFYAAEGL